MKSFLGWLMLLVALAVPAVLFYNWWTAMQVPTALETAEEVPADAGLRKNSSTQAPASKSAAAPEDPGAPSPGSKDGTVAAKGADAKTSAPLASSVDASDGGDSAGTEARAESISAAPKTARRPDSKTLQFRPKSDRDPTLSILDIKLIALREEARRRALMPVKPKKKKKRQTTPPIWTRIQLQGIVSTAQGRGAIINDEIYYRGDKVLGAQLRKITSSTVIFRYKGRTFYKKMQ